MTPNDMEAARRRGELRAVEGASVEAGALLVVIQ